MSRYALLLSAALAAGCAKSPAAQIADQVTAADKIAAVLGEITDDKTAAAVMPRLEAAADHFLKVRAAVNRTGRDSNPTEADWERAREQMRKGQEAQMRVVAATLRAMENAPAHAERIRKVVNRTGEESNRP